ncbi:flavin reductase family protein [Novosphingobium sp.]|uniref:flavin reductase family protein n=1 Tax=Novosphingobium sp. TaxID=1874826 RepID=UPI0035AE175F
MNHANDTLSYRKALGRFPTGVAFVATQAPDGSDIGILINSFTSVSLDPRLVLWSLDQRSSVRAIFVGASNFAISILTGAQRQLLAELSRPRETRFQGVAIRRGIGGAPVLVDAAAGFECTCERVISAGDHDLIMGRVENFELCDLPPLAFLAGQYGHVEIAA